MDQRKPERKGGGVLAVARTLSAMNYLKIPNWQKYQQYKDRDPKWIKLHRLLLEDYEFNKLTEKQQIHLIKIWLLAARMDNEIPFDEKWIRRRIGAESVIDLKTLVEAGYLAVYDTVQECTEVYLEKRREEKNREEEKVIVSVQEIDLVYSNYPSKCPISKRPTGKSSKCKDKIKKHLQDGMTKEQLIELQEMYIASCERTDTFIKNYMTFLNNLPDPDSLDDFELPPGVIV
jgi:hypothetical protein